MKNLLHILLLFLLTQATTFAQVDSTAYAHAMADSISVEKSTFDTTTEEVGKLSLVTFGVGSSLAHAKRQLPSVQQPITAQTAISTFTTQPIVNNHIDFNNALKGQNHYSKS